MHAELPENMTTEILAIGRAKNAIAVLHIDQNDRVGGRYKTALKNPFPDLPSFPLAPSFGEEADWPT